MKTLLNTSKKIITNDNGIDFHSLWFWFSIIELLLIIYLIYKLKSKSKKVELTDLDTNKIINSINIKIDMNNLMNSIHNSRTLYKELSKKCHPDRFINDPKQKKAEEIFQEITKNERNYEKLSLLKLRAENELNINF